MVSSGSGSFPSLSGASAAQINARTQQVAVRLLNVPEPLQNNSQAVRVEGEIISSGPERTLVVRTEHGEVSVQTKGSVRLREGQKIQIDVPANGAKEALIRPSLQGGKGGGVSETPSLLKAVADKLTSFARKADVPKALVTQAQILNTDGKNNTIKTASLLPNSAVRLSSVLGQGLSLSPVNGSQTFLASVINPILSLPVTGQSLQTVPLSFSNNSLFHSVVSGDVSGGGGQVIHSAFVTQGPVTSHGTLHSGQHFAFPVSLNGQGATFDARVLSHFLSSPVSNLFLPAQEGGQNFLLNGQSTALTFEVTGFTSLHQPIVTPLFATHGDGQVNNFPPSFVLQFPAGNVSVGQTIAFQPLGWGQGSSGAAPLDPLSSLMTMIKELHAVSPALAQALSVLTPSVSAPQQMGTSILFLFAALQSGNIESWVGSGMDKLSARHKILEALEQALKEGVQPRMVSNPSTGDWRAYSFPLLSQDTAVPVSLYVQDYSDQQDQGAQDNEEEALPTRFIFEFDLTHMGEVQVDGLMREKNVDIFVRTQRELSAEMKKTVRALYLNALDRSELTGDIAFQSERHKWVEVEDNKKASI